MASRLDVKVFENDSAKRRFHIHKRNHDRSVQPLDLTGYTIRLIVKTKLADVDASARFIYTSNTTPPGTEQNRIFVEDAKGGVFRVEFNSADLASAGSFFYRIRVEAGAEKDVVMYGDFVVVDT